MLRPPSPSTRSSAVLPLGRGLRRRDRRRRHDRPARPPRRGHRPQRRQLPPQEPRPRPHHTHQNRQRMTAPEGVHFQPPLRVRFQPSLTSPTPTPGGSSAGASPPRCPPACRWTLWRWPCGPATVEATASTAGSTGSFTTPTPGRKVDSNRSLASAPESGSRRLDERATKEPTLLAGRNPDRWSKLPRRSVNRCSEPRLLLANRFREEDVTLYEPRDGTVSLRSLRDLTPSFVNTLARCHSTVRALMKSSAPISGFVRPSRARRAM